MKEQGIFTAGFRLVIRHARLLGWLFLVNFILGLFASVAPRMMLGPVLDRSLEAEQLVRNFSFGAYLDLVGRPEISFAPLVFQSQAFALLYLLFTLFVAGGVMTTYFEDRVLTRADFFGNSGRYFFRLSRLALLGLLPTVVLAIAASLVLAATSAVDKHSPKASPGMYLLFAGFGVLALLGMFVRAWLDVTQTAIVETDGRSVIKLSSPTLVACLRHAVQLIWAYLRISIVTGVLIALAGWIWVRLPHAAIGRSFVVLECMLAITLFGRLWQRATAVTCYQQIAPIPRLEESPQVTPFAPEPMLENAPPEPISGEAINQAPAPDAESGHRAV